MSANIPASGPEGPPGPFSIAVLATRRTAAQVVSSPMAMAGVTCVTAAALLAARLS